MAYRFYTHLQHFRDGFRDHVFKTEFTFFTKIKYNFFFLMNLLVY